MTKTAIDEEDSKDIIADLRAGRETSGTCPSHGDIVRGVIWIIRRLDTNGKHDAPQGMSISILGGRLMDLRNIPYQKSGAIVRSVMVGALAILFLILFAQGHSTRLTTKRLAAKVEITP